MLAVALGLGLVCGACIGMRIDAEVLAASGPAAGWSDAGRVPVRLSAAEGRLALELELAPGRVVEVWREGDGVLVAEPDGTRRQRAWVRVDAGAEDAALRFEGREYRGPVVVEPHPAGGLRATNLPELEEYVAAVVAAEIPLWNANDAELGSQAIVARSYALGALASRRRSSAQPFLWDDVRDQMYRGAFLPTAVERARALDRRLERAIEVTRGRYLVSAGVPVTAVYHASCGGRTSRSSEVFGGTDDVARSASCEPCAEGAAPAWSWTASAGDLARLAAAFGIGARCERLEPVQLDFGGRWLQVELHGPGGSVTRRLEDLRRELGYERLPSGCIVRTWPTPGAPIRSGLYFEGRGNGHGVGLCQVGARGYGERGWSTERILQHYYRGARVERL